MVMASSVVEAREKEVCERKLEDICLCQLANVHGVVTIHIIIVRQSATTTVRTLLQNVSALLDILLVDPGKQCTHPLPHIEQ